MCVSRGAEQQIWRSSTLKIGEKERSVALKKGRAIQRGSVVCREGVGVISCSTDGEVPVRFEGQGYVSTDCGSSRWVLQGRREHKPQAIMQGPSLTWLETFSVMVWSLRCVSLGRGDSTMFQSEGASVGSTPLSVLVWKGLVNRNTNKSAIPFALDGSTCTLAPWATLSELFVTASLIPWS